MSSSRLAGGDLLSGIVVEVKDLRATRAFYEIVFQHTPGTWREERGSIRFSAGGQAVEFVRRARPRTSGSTALHHAYRVSAGQLPATVDALRAIGHTGDWWHEDHVSERDLMPYFSDPSGNWVQLVASDAVDGLVDHVGMEFADLEYAEDFYVMGLGAVVDSYHGLGDEPGLSAQPWTEGDDPCAPWTRYRRFSFRSRTVEGRITPQLYIGLGGVRLGLFLARGHNQEPPEDVVKGTPSVRLRTGRSVAAVAEHLGGAARAAISARYSGRTIAFEVEGNTIYLRDPGGNYVQLECAP